MPTKPCSYVVYLQHKHGPVNRLLQCSHIIVGLQCEIIHLQPQKSQVNAIETSALGQSLHHQIAEESYFVWPPPEPFGAGQC